MTVVHLIELMSDPVILSNTRCLPPTQRLVVLMPEYTVDLASLSHIIRDQAINHTSQILIMSVVKEPFSSVHMAHVLRYLFAFIHDPFLHVDTRVEMNTTWLKAIKKVTRPGDTFLVLSDHSVRKGLFWNQPVSELIAKRLDLPVYILTVHQDAGKNGRF